jgi:hypothetical protein
VRVDGGVGDVYAVHTLIAADTDARDTLLRNLLNQGDLGHSMGHRLLLPSFSIFLLPFSLPSSYHL